MSHRSSVLEAHLGGRSLWAAVLLSVAWIALFTVLTAVTAPAGAGRQVVGDGVYLAPVILAATLTAALARRADERWRHV